jgi:hypothetical protein
MPNPLSDTPTSLDSGSLKKLLARTGDTLRVWEELLDKGMETPVDQRIINRIRNLEANCRGAIILLNEIEAERKLPLCTVHVTLEYRFPRGDMEERKISEITEDVLWDRISEIEGIGTVTAVTTVKIARDPASADLDLEGPPQ